MGPRLGLIIYISLVPGDADVDVAGPGTTLWKLMCKLYCPWTEHNNDAVVEDWSSGKEFGDGLELLHWKRKQISHEVIIEAKKIKTIFKKNIIIIINYNTQLEIILHCHYHVKTVHWFNQKLWYNYLGKIEVGACVRVSACMHTRAHVCVCVCV